MTARAQKRPLTAATLAEDRRDARSLRRGLTHAGAILGVAPFLQAIAPHWLPAIVRGVTALWAATMLAWLAASLDEQLLARKQRHSNPPAE